MSWTKDDEAREYVPGKPYCRRFPTCSQRLWPRFDDYLRARDLNPDLARKNLWFPTRTIDGYDRVVVPGTSDQTGNLYWQARLMEAPGGPERVPGATISSGVGILTPRRWESPHGISRGNSVCLVWPREAGPGRPTAVVEGPMDALAAAGEGLVAVGLMGVSPSLDVLRLTSKLLQGTRPLMIMDLNAEKEMAENQDKLREIGLVCVLVSPYPGKDLAALDRLSRRRVLQLSP